MAETAKADGARPGPSRLGDGEVRRAGAAPLALACLLSPRLAAALGRYLSTVLRFFFLSQWGSRLAPRSMPPRRVDHPLDGLVPFEPARSGTYLHFVRLWITALSYARRELGPGSAAACAAFLDGLSACYREAYSVYRRRVSTTSRPTVAANAEFRLVYLVDPHLYCVPSLHVMIVCHVFTAFERMFREAGRAEAAAAPRLELYRRAVAITDSVLYVKQHSVNCVPAALYYSSRLMPEFGRPEARAFLSDLLADLPSGADRRAILDYMGGLYERLMDEGEAEGAERWRPVLRFLDSYRA